MSINDPEWGLFLSVNDWKKNHKFIDKQKRG